MYNSSTAKKNGKNISCHFEADGGCSKRVLCTRNNNTIMIRVTTGKFFAVDYIHEFLHLSHGLSGPPLGPKGGGA